MMEQKQFAFFCIYLVEGFCLIGFYGKKLVIFDFTLDFEYVQCWSSFASGCYSEKMLLWIDENHNQICFEKLELHRSQFENVKESKKQLIWVESILKKWLPLWKYQDICMFIFRIVCLLSGLVLNKPWDPSVSVLLWMYCELLRFWVVGLFLNLTALEAGKIFLYILKTYKTVV